MSGLEVRVLGAGIVGLAVAWELARRGHDVGVVDPGPGSGASYAAAGMLSPGGELWHGETALFPIARDSADLWPAWAGELGIELRPGTLLAALDAGDLQLVERQLALLAAHDSSARPLTRRELLACEPRLGRVVGGALLPRDHSVDPRAVVAALRDRLGDRIRPQASGTAAWTVVATGARLPAPYASLVRGVRGEVLRLRVAPADLPDRTVRAWVHGEQVYAVPRAVGELVVGATQQEHDGPPVVTAEGVWRLLDLARRLLPGLDRAELVEATARDRPGTLDNLPLVGPAAESGVVLAAGHYRHGVLLAPWTAGLVADHIEHGRVEDLVDPRRFVVPTSNPTSGGA